MQPIENKTLCIVKLLCDDESDRPSDACFPGTLTAEKSEGQTVHGHTQQVKAYRYHLPKPVFSNRHILFVIAGTHLDFLSFFIRLVNSHRIVKFFVAYKTLVNNFFLSQPERRITGNTFPST